MDILPSPETTQKLTTEENGFLLEKGKNKEEVLEKNEEQEQEQKEPEREQVKEASSDVALVCTESPYLRIVLGSYHCPFLLEKIEEVLAKLKLTEKDKSSISIRTPFENFLRDNPLFLDWFQTSGKDYMESLLEIIRLMKEQYLWRINLATLQSQFCLRWNVVIGKYLKNKAHIEIGIFDSFMFPFHSWILNLLFLSGCLVYESEFFAIQEKPVPKERYQHLDVLSLDLDKKEKKEKEKRIHPKNQKQNQQQRKAK